MLCTISGLRTCYLSEDYLSVPWVEDLEVVGVSRSPIPDRRWALGRDDHAPDAPSVLRPGRLLLLLSLLGALPQSEGSSVTTDVPSSYRSNELDLEIFLVIFLERR